MKVIHIYGASGAGTTTLGKAISETFRYQQMDTDDYFWLPTNPPFTTKREIKERISLMEKDIKEHEKVVITGSLCGWGDVLIPFFDFVIRVITPSDIRMQRLKEREFNRFGNRIMEDGDMCVEHQKFLTWASEYDRGDEQMRSNAMHDKWSLLLSCESVNIDGTRPIDENIEFLRKYLE